MPNPKSIASFDVALESDHDRVKRLVSSILNRAPVRSPITLGVEVEFFLENLDSQIPVLVGDSQRFLLELANIQGWKVFSKNSETGLIQSVSREHSDGRYDSIKYEHPPAMMELALGYCENLVVTRDRIEEVYQALYDAGKNAGLKVKFAAKTPETEIDWNAVDKVGPQYRARSESRHAIFQKHSPLEKTGAFVDFPAFTAATQYHIGGVKWWERRPQFVEQLYKAEFLISANAYPSQTAFFERWNAYKKVFSGMSFVGFPEIKSWTLDSWISGILESPWNEQSVRSFGSHVSKWTDAEIESKLKDSRDLQLIKPKWIGTLEYRSDPATADIQLILSQAALRFATYFWQEKYAGDIVTLPASMEELARAWWMGNQLERFGPEFEALKDKCWSILCSRGLNEEGLL
jgi:hypothetical protein